MKKENIRHWSDKQLVSYLEKMAQQGWFPTNFSDYYVFLTEDKPKQVRFLIDYYPSIYRSTESIKKNFTSYLESSEEAGWHYIASHEAQHLFYGEDLFLNPVVDDRLKWDSLKKQQRNHLIISLCLLALLFAFISSQLNKLDFLLTWTRLSYIIVSLLGISFCLIFIALIIKNHLTVKPGNDFNQSFNTQANKYLRTMPRLYNLFFFLFMFTLFINSLLDSILTGSYSSSGLPIFSVLLFQMIKKFILDYSGSYSKEKTNKLSGILFLIEIGLIFSCSYMLDDFHSSTPQPNTIVTIQDLSNGTVATDYSSYSEQSGPLIKKSLSYQEASNLHDLTFKSHLTDSPLIKEYLYKHYLNSAKEESLPNSLTIEYPADSGKLNDVITMKNTFNDLYVLATIDSNVIFIKYYNPLQETNEILNKIANTLNP